jgi:hypothetical protein
MRKRLMNKVFGLSKSTIHKPSIHLEMQVTFRRN